MTTEKDKNGHDPNTADAGAGAGGDDDDKGSEENHKEMDKGDGNSAEKRGSSKDDNDDDDNDNDNEEEEQEEKEDGGNEGRLRGFEETSREEEEEDREHASDETNSNREDNPIPGIIAVDTARDTGQANDAEEESKVEEQELGANTDILNSAAAPRTSIDDQFDDGDDDHDEERGESGNLVAANAEEDDSDEDDSEVGLLMIIDELLTAASSDYDDVHDNEGITDDDVADGNGDVENNNNNGSNDASQRGGGEGEGNIDEAQQQQALQSQTRRQQQQRRPTFRDAGADTSFSLQVFRIYDNEDEDDNGMSKNSNSKVVRGDASEGATEKRQGRKGKRTSLLLGKSSSVSTEPQLQPDGTKKVALQTRTGHPVRLGPRQRLRRSLLLAAQQERDEYHRSLWTLRLLQYIMAFLVMAVFMGFVLLSPSTNLAHPPNLVFDWPPTMQPHAFEPTPLPDYGDDDENRNSNDDHDNDDIWWESDHAAVHAMTKLIAEEGTDKWLRPSKELNAQLDRYGRNVLQYMVTSDNITMKILRDYNKFRFASQRHPVVEVEQAKKYLLERYALFVLMVVGTNEENDETVHEKGQNGRKLYNISQTVCEWNQVGKRGRFSDTGIFCWENIDTLPPPPKFRFVEEISLPHSNFSGEFPADLGLVTTLRRLNLQGNLLQGTLPSSLSMIRELRILNVSHNQLTGAIPWSLFWKVPAKLKKLHLQSNQLDNFIMPPNTYLEAETLQASQHLRSLRLENNNFRNLNFSILCEWLPHLKEFTADCGAGTGNTCSCCTECIDA